MVRLLIVVVLGFCSAVFARPAPCSMEAVLLGTGYPVPFPDRAGPSTAVVANGKYFVVDAGRAVTMRLAALHPRMPHVEAVFLTHLHSDHTTGLPDLFDTSWLLERRTVPFELYGPAGTRELAAGMIEFLAADIHIRRDLSEFQPAAGATVNTHIVEEGTIYERDGLKITAFAVDHRPVVPAFGYRFDCGGKSIVISGDTGPSDNLVRFAKDADVLIHEAYLPGTFRNRHTAGAKSANAQTGGSVELAQVSEILSRYHTTAEQAGEIAARANVKHLVLTHVIPPNRSEEMLRLASQTFKGEVTVGTDLLHVVP
jgi:ribonuclease Z